MLDKDQFCQDCASIRKQSPLILCITNYVAMEINANALLAVGASPAMSWYRAEIKELVGISRAVSINIGCLDDNQIEGMEAAAAESSAGNIPWVLDPAGVCASAIRRETAKRLISEYRPAVIRGNASEISVLSGKNAAGGLDSSISSDAAVEAAKQLAAETGAVVSLSGATDYITDGNRLEIIRNGNELMSRITAMGCTATVLTAAFCSVSSEPFEGALHAMALMGVAGERAARNAKGPGSLKTEFIDMLYGLSPQETADSIRQ